MDKQPITTAAREAGTPGQTLAKKRALAHYTSMQAELEAERGRRIDAQLATDALLDRVRKTGTGECADAADDLTWRDVIGLFVADMVLTLLCLAVWAAFGFGVLAALAGGAK